ncbi:unnamed protein product [Amoebophrya sp. A120]|nr:unnamed protein product [Amoebophrya sp. A120]|eukprot:GSA120T00003200001.1
MMRAVVVENAKAPVREAMRVVANYPRPELTPSHNVLVKVHYTAVNRADLMQRQGKYPPPPGASSVLGLECSGEIVEVGTQSSAPSRSSKWKPGDRVMGLLEGGGYAEYAACAPGSLMRVPDKWSLEQAACVPEVWLTAYQLLRKVAKTQPGDNVLLHAGASAVSLAAIQLARHVLQAKHVTALTRSARKLDQCKQMGADEALLREDFFANFRTEDAEAKNALTKFDVVLDPVVGEDFFTCLSEATNRDARYVVYAAMGGPKVPDFNFGPVFRKSLSILTSTLRARSVDYKADLIEMFEEEVLQPFLVDAGSKAELNLDTVLALDQVAEAHERLESNDTGGKIVLKVAAEE